MVVLKQQMRQISHCVINFHFMKNTSSSIQVIDRAMALVGVLSVQLLLMSLVRSARHARGAVRIEG